MKTRAEVISETVGNLFAINPTMTLSDMRAELVSSSLWETGEDIEIACDAAAGVIFSQHPMQQCH